MCIIFSALLPSIFIHFRSRLNAILVGGSLYGNFQEIHSDIGPDKDSLCTLNCIYYLQPINLNMFWVAQKNRLIETVLLSTLFWLNIRY